ncbi:hypothetical protein Tco_0706769 [Tanacetum coccineum]|uniref:Aminotransferase-like plant mobile domain-containing protein n=1 Tax=Tanacetum coccineum TaxID=301880 RepID=A0ABQ4Y9X2_9ASTR
MSCAKEIEEILEIKVYEMGGDEEIFTFEPWRRDFDIKEPVYTELCHEFYATYKFDEMVTDGDLMSRKVIKFRLVGFETYFRGGLRNDDHSNVNQYWSEISSENGLILSRSSAGTIRKPILRVLQKMITYGLCQRTTGYDKVQRNELWLMSMFESKNQNGYANVAWFIARWLKRKGVGSQRESMICYGSLDTTTLKEMINSNGRFIAEEPAPGDPRVIVPRLLHHSISDLYDRIGRMEIQQGRLCTPKLFEEQPQQEKEYTRRKRKVELCRNSCSKATTELRFAEFENEELEEEIEEESEEEEEEDDLEYFNTFPTKEELEYHKYLVKNNRPPWIRAKARIRRIFLDGYGVLDVRIVFFRFLRLSSRMRAF